VWREKFLNPERKSCGFENIRIRVGGMGKNPKKKNARVNAKKKIRAKKKIKKKIHAEGRSNCDFYLIY